jgi:hypothetical protein
VGVEVERLLGRLSEPPIRSRRSARSEAETSRHQLPDIRITPTTTSTAARRPRLAIRRRRGAIGLAYLPAALTFWAPAQTLGPAAGALIREASGRSRA